MTDLTEPTTTAPLGAAVPQSDSDAAPTAKEQATAVASSATDQASAVASTASDEVKAVASEALDEAKGLFGDAREQLRSQASEQSDKVASLIGDVGSQMRTMAEAGQSGLARDIVTQVADRADRVAQRMGDGGLERTLDDARRLARNRPGVFLAGAALAGFLVARVIRAADTDSLKRAASPDSNANGASGADPVLAPAPRIEAPLQPAPQPNGVPSTGFPQ